MKNLQNFLFMMLDVCLQLLEQQAGASDDFQEASAEEKEAFKRKYSMDVALEDKICDLYDHFVEVVYPSPPFPPQNKNVLDKIASYLKQFVLEIYCLYL